MHVCFLRSEKIYLINVPGSALNDGIINDILEWQTTNDIRSKLIMISSDARFSLKKNKDCFNAQLDVSLHDC